MSEVNYIPTPPPSDIEDMQRYLEAELNRLGWVISQSQRVAVFYTEPPQPEEGFLATAPGSPDWDPGAGAGTYIWRSGVWAKLG